VSDEFEKYDAFAKQMEEKFPKMFVGTYGGFACGKGWWPILEKLCDNIQHHIDWRNTQRDREIELHAAYTNGYEALIKFYQGKSAEPSDWDESKAQETLENGVEVPKEVRQVVVAQIKEKFGGLRFYYDGGDAEISGMVRMAEAWAGNTCETCGAPGTSRSNGWIKTLCDTHEAERQLKRKEHENLCNQ
jgi:hypothetical protein